jgi:hypothetical protein
MTRRARGPGDRGRRPPPGGRPGAIGLSRLDDRAFELAHPRCVEERREDYEEGLAIWRAGEPEEARDALRFALEGCGDNLWVHVALGRIALEAMRDPRLARGHFGYAVELVERALPRGFSGTLPSDRPANRPFYDALNGLLACCEALGLAAEAAELRRLGDALSGRAGPA